MKTFFTVFLFFILPYTVISQTEKLSWIHTIIDDQIIEFSKVHILENEEIIIGGHFSNYYGVDIDPTDDGEFILNGGREVFIQKYNKDGALIWISPILGNGLNSVSAIKSNANNEIYILGDFSGSTDFDPEDNYSFILNNNTEGSDPYNKDIFLLKLDENGKFMWVKTFGGISDDLAVDFEFDSYENIIITGTFESSIQFDNNGKNNGLVHSISGQDIFVLKLGEFGDFLWVKTFGGYEEKDKSTSLDIDENDNIYISGNYGSCVDFNPSPLGVKMRCSNGRFDAYVLRLDKDGYYNWVFTYGNRSWDIAPKLLIDKNNIYVAGAALGELELTFNGSLLQKIGSPSYWSGLIIKMNLEGKVSWASTTKTLGYGNQCRVSSLDIDEKGIIYLAGRFFGPLIFGDQPHIHVNNNDSPVATHNFPDLFYCRINSTNGKFISGTTFLSKGRDECNDIGVSNNAIYLVGKFTNRMDFDPSPNSKVIEGNGGFFLKLEETECSSIIDFCNYKLMPNPAINKIFIQLDKTFPSINGAILSSNGQKIKYFNFEHTNQIELEISNLSEGIYYINLYDNSGASICNNGSLKFIKIK